MAIPKVVSITGTATLIAASNPSRTLLQLQNVATVAIYIGADTNVTTANGMRMEPGVTWLEERTKDNSEFYYHGAYYGIVASGSAGMRVWEKERIR